MIRHVTIPQQILSVRFHTGCKIAPLGVVQNIVKMVEGCVYSVIILKVCRYNIDSVVVCFHFGYEMRITVFFEFEYQVYAHSTAVKRFM
jgi:hypothetical protein